MKQYLQLIFTLPTTTTLKMMLKNEVLEFQTPLKNICLYEIKKTAATCVATALW